MPRKRPFTSGADAGTQAKRRTQVAAEQITAHVSTLGDHSRCDPKQPESMCVGCRELWESAETLD